MVLKIQPGIIIFSYCSNLPNGGWIPEGNRRAFGVKNHQLNDLDRATHTNVEHQQREFYVDTLMDILTGYEQELTYKLFTQKELDKGYYIKFNVNAILRADPKTRYEGYRIAIQSGFMTANEVRALEEMEAKGGDRLLINGNMMPIEMAGEQYKKGGGEMGSKKFWNFKALDDKTGS